MQKMSSGIVLATNEELGAALAAECEKVAGLRQDVADLAAREKASVSDRDKKIAALEKALEAAKDSGEEFCQRAQGLAADVAGRDETIARYREEVSSLQGKVILAAGRLAEVQALASAAAGTAMVSLRQVRSWDRATWPRWRPPRITLVRHLDEHIRVLRAISGLARPEEGSPGGK